MSSVISNFISCSFLYNSNVNVMKLCLIQQSLSRIVSTIFDFAEKWTSILSKYVSLRRMKMLSLHMSTVQGLGQPTLAASKQWLTGRKVSGLVIVTIVINSKNLKSDDMSCKVLLLLLLDLKSFKVIQPFDLAAIASLSKKDG